MNLCLLLGALAAAAPVPEVEGRAVPEFRDAFEARSFRKGALHAHSDEHAERSYERGKGDGDSSPAAVFAAYAARGFAFVSLTDHNELTVPSAAGPAALPGIELTSHYGAKPTKPVHVNAVCVAREERGVARPEGSAAETLQETLDRAAAAGAALVVVNHPNYAHALSGADLAAAKGFNALEIASGHKTVRADDASASKSAEELWDDLLRAGREVWAVAADDAHHFQGSGDAVPGQAWVSAWGEDLCAALKAGRFYATTGPELESLSVSGDTLSLRVAGRWDARRDTVEFIADGKVAAASRAAAASYTLKGGEGYVRARVTRGGRKAWTQAYRLR